ncbi:MAG TPA: DUF2339 domain-containing protein [Armatimonadota bacterium]
MQPVDELRIEVQRMKAELARLELRLNALTNEPAPRESVQTPPFTPPMPAQPAPVPQFHPVQHPPAAPKPAQTDLEAVIGGNWLNRIGAATLIIGMAFFLKYAVDNNWINETGRIIIGLLVGLGCLGLGERFQRKNLPQFAQGLSGAGIAILFFSIFAAYSFYALIPQLPAFGFMTVVTAAAIALSVRYDSAAIATLGILGGFLTPIMLSGGKSGGAGGTNTGVLVYIAILDLGILGITRFKNWRGLNVVSLFGTFIIFANISGAWENKIGLSIGFATIYFLIFAAQAYVQNVTAKREISFGDVLMASLPPVLYFLHCWSLLNTTKYGLISGPFAIVLAAAYVTLSHKVFLTHFEDRKLCAMYLAIASGFLVIAVPLQLSGYWVALGWGMEAAVLSYIGFRLGSWKTRCVALGILALAGFNLLIHTIDALMDWQSKAFTDLRMPTYLLLAGVAALIIYYYRRHKDVLTDVEQFLAADGLVVCAAFQLLIGLSSEVYMLEHATRTVNPSVALTLLWVVYGLIAIVLGIRYKHRPIRIFALVILGITLWKTYISDVWMLETVWRIVAFLALGVILLAVSYFYTKYRTQMVKLVGKDGVENEQE